MTSDRSRFLPALSPLTAGLAVAVCVSLVSCSSDPSQGHTAEPGAAEPTELRARVQATHPWNPSSFTQGVETLPDGDLLVGTGKNGQSRIYKTTLDGQERESQSLSQEFFGEGVTVDGQYVWQLTWRNNTAWKRDLDGLQDIGQFRYEGEGWGICSQGGPGHRGGGPEHRLVMSDGSGSVIFRDPDTFAEIGRKEITLGGKPTTRLNELECADDGTVWANVWQSSQIYRIDPDAGEVTGVVDLDGTLPAASRPGADVLNGIAIAPGGGLRFYLTGKFWDEMYEVEFTELDE